MFGKTKHKDLSTKTLLPIAEDEQILFRRDLNDGKWIHPKIVMVYIVTNYRIATMFPPFDEPVIPVIGLTDISDVIAINRHRETEGGYQGTGVHVKGMSSRQGRYKGKSIEYGDIVISSPVTDDQTWYNIPDPNSLVRLIKSLMKQRKGA